VSREICAVDLTTSSIQVLVRRGSHLDGVDAVLPADAIQNGRVLQPVAVQLYLTRLWKALKLRFVEIRLCISDSACVMRFLDYPRMPAKELERSLRIELERELPMNPREAYLAWQVVEVRDNQQTVLVVGAWRDVVEGYLEALEGLGHVAVIEPRSMALARAAGVADALLLDWTGDQLQVAVVEKRRVTYTNSAVVTNGAVDSLARVIHLTSSLVPKTGRRSPLPPRLVLLGELYGREEVGRALGAFEVLPEWRPPHPFGSFAAASQAANIGMLMRN